MGCCQLLCSFGDVMCDAKCCVIAYALGGRNQEILASLESESSTLRTRSLEAEKTQTLNFTPSEDGPTWPSLDQQLSILGGVRGCKATLQSWARCFLNPVLDAQASEVHPNLAMTYRNRGLNCNVSAEQTVLPFF